MTNHEEIKAVFRQVKYLVHTKIKMVIYEHDWILINDGIEIKCFWSSLFMYMIEWILIEKNPLQMPNIPVFELKANEDLNRCELEMRRVLILGIF